MDKEKQDRMKNAFALVTGAGQGIGFAFANSLANRRHNVILVSLPGEGLAEKASALSEKFQVEVLYHETDLTIDGNCQALHSWVTENGYQVDILINNAGIGSAGPFEEFSTGFYQKQVTLNVMVPVLLTRLFLPGMRKMESAYILNMGSMGSFFNMPNKEVYSASKSFILSFSRSLQATLHNSSINVTVISPGPVDSNPRLLEIHKNMKGIARKAVMKPEEVAEEGLKALFSGKKEYIPGGVNRFLLFLNRLVPASVRQAIIRKEMKRQEEIGISH
jgi:short-subunit dehydrogenase